jgi:flagellum-specific peptidoglycan hydrolase FlgJ
MSRRTSKTRRQEALAELPKPSRVFWWGLGFLGVAGLAWYASNASGGDLVPFSPMIDATTGETTYTVVAPWTTSDFVVNVGNAVISVAPNLSLEATLMVVAHAAYESGWGKGATAAKEGNNLFNITAGPKWAGLVVGGNDVEYDANGNVKPITQRFRAYPGIEASIADYLAFLNTPKYATAYQALLAADPAAFIQALSAAHYFTLPEAQYEAGYRSVLQRVSSSWNTAAVA